MHPGDPTHAAAAEAIQRGSMEEPKPEAAKPELPSGQVKTEEKEPETPKPEEKPQEDKPATPPSPPGDPGAPVPHPIVMPPSAPPHGETPLPG